MEGIKHQISKLINKSNNILVAAPENINGDALGSALALKNALEKMGKSAQLIVPKEIPTKFQFLPKTNSLSYETFLEREFVLSIKNEGNHINNLYYEKKDDLLHIYLGTNKKIEEKDFLIKPHHPFDLVVAINSRDFENLGKAFEHYPELFFDTPVINIDNHPENENFGEINLVDITSSSVSEIIMDLIDFMDRNLLDKEIATLILTGLIDATGNFQSVKTTPRTFNNAAILINRGGDQQQIVRYFYKSKSLEFLRLWGRILHKLSWNENNKLAWGKIEQKDFEETTTSPECLPQAFEEIKMAFPEMITTFLVWQSVLDNKISGAIYSLNQEILQNLVFKLNGFIKNNNLLFNIKMPSLIEAEEAILNLIKEEL